MELQGGSGAPPGSYTPEVGDCVLAVGRYGEFRVTCVHRRPNGADLELLSPAGKKYRLGGKPYTLKNIPWGVLTKIPCPGTS